MTAVTQNKVKKVFFIRVIFLWLDGFTLNEYCYYDDDYLMPFPGKFMRCLVSGICNSLDGGLYNALTTRVMFA